MDDKYPIENYKDKTIIITKDQFLSTELICISNKHFSFISKVIVSEGLIKDRIESIAKMILKDYYNDTVHLLVILKGAVVFSNTLSNKIYELLKNDNDSKMKFYFEFLQISSYINEESTGNISFLTDPKLLENLRNKNILVVEDIYDSGHSLNHLLNLIKEKYQPKSLKTCVLFQKMNENNLKYNLNIEYLGFLVPNVFLIGYGIDYNEEFRDLNHLCMINQKGVETFKIK